MLLILLSDFNFTENVSSLPAQQNGVRSHTKTSTKKEKKNLHIRRRVSRYKGVTRQK